MHSHVHSLAHHGYIRGLTLSNNACHYYGNLRYALPPPQRWRKAIPLPDSYSYGSLDDPADCQGVAGVCPQGGFLEPPDESAWTEDCFRVNVYVPVGEVPDGGWPILFFIHGGWLQIGTPNSVNPAALLSETPVQAIVVLPAYRLNVFGFLYAEELERDAAAAHETPGNHGFWDQRLALEWTREYGPLFGGDVRKITVAGYSAGAHSAFHQLAYDLRASPDPGIIKQACIWSNSPILQPKSPAEAQPQFNALLHALHIEPSLPGPEKLARLREVPARVLLHAALHTGCQYRPVTESSTIGDTSTSTSTSTSTTDETGEPFIPSTLFSSIDNGTFAQTCSARGIRLLLGECRDENVLYSKWFPPSANSLPALRERLYAEYPRRAVDALLPLYTRSNPNSNPHPGPGPGSDGDGGEDGDGNNLPPGSDNWDCDVFGRIYADMQVYKMQRGFVAALLRGGFPPDRLFRYRVEMRVKSVDAVLPPEWGVTHSSDMAIWFWGNGVGDGVRDEERAGLLEGLVGLFARFVSGLPVEWGTENGRQIRTLREDGVVIWEDELWDGAMELWDTLRDARALI